MLRKGILLFAVFCLSSSAFAEETKTPDQSAVANTPQVKTEPAAPHVKQDITQKCDGVDTTDLLVTEEWIVVPGCELACSSGRAA